MLLANLQLFNFPHAIFIDPKTINFSVSSKKTVCVEVVPLAIKLQPFAGYHDAVSGEVVVILAISAESQPMTGLPLSPRYCPASLFAQPCTVAGLVVAIYEWKYVPEVSTLKWKPLL
ncbi:hypothetical protein [Lacrimispora sp.]|uniref:hypothetical protein n=1 Tax=Lacrimispora sp. TaxID=2719234 RepID=UPI0028A19628|nr:hypothetical protein [Lacrimispora sp.]